MTHAHYCGDCGAFLYQCDQVVTRDDAGASCRNGGQEQCDACRAMGAWLAEQAAIAALDEDPDDHVGQGHIGKDGRP